MSAKVMVLFGEGINCENETALAFQKAGAVTELVHVREWLRNPKQLLDFQILALPGGFSFGDELHSGQILALTMKYKLGSVIQDFIQAKGLILGICNGFQVLMKLGAFESFKSERTMTLFHNSSFKFQDRWTALSVPESNCVWTKDISQLQLPMRHGEGRIVADQLPNGTSAALFYTEDVNGSFQRIAGLTDKTGQILGLMPHPEAALEAHLWPSTLEIDTASPLKIFKNAVQFAQEHA